MRKAIDPWQITYLTIEHKSKRLCATDYEEPNATVYDEIIEPLAESLKNENAK